MADIGQHIRKLRLSKNRSPQEVASYLDVTPGFIRNVETGREFPSKYQVIRSAGCFGVNTIDLLVAYQKQRMLQEEISEQGERKSCLINHKKTAQIRYQNMIHELQHLMLGNLQIETFKPASPLNLCIESMTFYNGHNFNRTFEKVLPDASVQLFIELDGRERRLKSGSHHPSRTAKKAWVTGVQRKPFSYLLEEAQTILSMRFHTGGFYALTGIPQSEIENGIVEAETLFGPSILQLREAMLETKNAQDIFLMAENYFSRDIERPDTERRVVSYVCTHIDEPLRSLVSKSGYSHKHLIRLFKKYLGVTPKYFQRITRFNKVLDDIHAKRTVIDWAGISSDHDFFDQAHFIKEFNHFTGMSPGSYLAAGSTCSKILYLPD